MHDKALKIVFGLKLSKSIQFNLRQKKRLLKKFKNMIQKKISKLIKLKYEY